MFTPPPPSLLMLSKLHGFHLGLCSTKISAPFHHDHRERMSTHCAVLRGGGSVIKTPEREGEMREERMGVTVGP